MARPAPRPRFRRSGTRSISFALPSSCQPSALLALRASSVMSFPGHIRFWNRASRMPSGPASGPLNRISPAPDRLPESTTISLICNSLPPSSRIFMAAVPGSPGSFAQPMAGTDAAASSKSTSAPITTFCSRKSLSSSILPPSAPPISSPVRDATNAASSPDSRALSRMATRSAAVSKLTRKLLGTSNNCAAPDRDPPDASKLATRSAFSTVPMIGRLPNSPSLTTISTASSISSGTRIRPVGNRVATINSAVPAISISAR
ncbi:MAG: Uncharacterised protein [SAR116 cluster bacterium]|nr:MAG: Uncharacterised protein [SAR116 cluster bacterium]